MNVRHRLRRWASVEEYLAHVEANIGARAFEVQTAPPLAPVEPERDYHDNPF